MKKKRGKKNNNECNAEFEYHMGTRWARNSCDGAAVIMQARTKTLDHESTGGESAHTDTRAHTHTRIEGVPNVRTDTTPRRRNERAHVHTNTSARWNVYLKKH